MVKSLPTLKYNLNWSIESGSEHTSEDHKKTVQDFLSDIDVVRFIRDGLWETAQIGTVVTCLRSKKYVQFLNLDDLRIAKQRNGKWIVEFDLKSLDNIRDTQDKLNMINSLPNEVTLQKYNRYKKSNDEKGRFIELSNCHVSNLDGKRNSPIGFPITLGAWFSVLQKEMIDKVEQSVSDRLLRQILVLSASWLDKEETKPVPKEVLSGYFKEVTNLLQKKDRNSGGSNNSSGTGTIMLPHYLELEALKIDTTMFKRELYDKINGDIFGNLGISESLISGKGGNFSSATVNEKKFFSFIFTIVEQFESVINDYFKSILPKEVSCRIKFDRSTILDRESDIKTKYDLYLQTGLITPWIEAVMDAPISDIATQRRHEIEMGYGDIFKPALNAYTSSGKDDEQSKGIDEIDNDNTAKGKDDNSNGTPSPSD